MENKPGLAPKKDSRLHKLLRRLILAIIKLFYPHIEVQFAQNLPPAGPVIYVSNHPNGLLDPLAIMLGLDKHLSFLAKSTLFAYPVLGTLVKAFGAFPVYLHREAGKFGGPKKDPAEENEATFAQCRNLLYQGGAMALFPEGTTHSGSELLPLKTGTARIALSAEAEANWQAGIKIVPVGLWYEEKTAFRSSVLLVIGQPFGLKDYAPIYAADERRAVEELTQSLQQNLDKVVLQAENAELLNSLPILAAWTAPGGAPPSLAEQHQWTTKVLAAFNRLQQTHPAQLEAVSQQARDFANALQQFGISDPWTLEFPRLNQKRLLGLLIGLALSFPLALPGFIMSYIPYRIAGPLARQIIGKNTTQVGTLKLVFGAFLLIIAWLIEALVIGAVFAPVWGIITFLLALPLGYLSLLWGERFIEVRKLLTGNWLNFSRRQLARALRQSRKDLTQQVAKLVALALQQTEKD